MPALQNSKNPKRKSATSVGPHLELISTATVQSGPTGPPPHSVIASAPISDAGSHVDSPIFGRKTGMANSEYSYSNPILPFGP